MHQRVACAQLRLLFYPDEFLVGYRLRYDFAAVTVHHTDFFRHQRTRRVEHMGKQRSTSQRVQHLGQCRVHAFAESGGENDYVQFWHDSRRQSSIREKRYSGRQEPISPHSAFRHGVRRAAESA